MLYSSSWNNYRYPMLAKYPLQEIGVRRHSGNHCGKMEPQRWVPTMYGVFLGIGQFPRNNSRFPLCTADRDLFPGAVHVGELWSPRISLLGHKCWLNTRQTYCLLEVGRTEGVVRASSPLFS